MGIEWENIDVITEAHEAADVYLYISKKDKDGLNITYGNITVCKVCNKPFDSEEIEFYQYHHDPICVAIATMLNMVTSLKGI